MSSVFCGHNFEFSTYSFNVIFFCSMSYIRISTISCQSPLTNSKNIFYHPVRILQNPLYFPSCSVSQAASSILASKKLPVFSMALHGLFDAHSLWILTCKIYQVLLWMCVGYKKTNYKYNLLRPQLNMDKTKENETQNLHQRGHWKILIIRVVNDESSEEVKMMVYFSS